MQAINPFNDLWLHIQLRSSLTALYHYITFLKDEQSNLDLGFMQGLCNQEINNVCYCKKWKSFHGKVKLQIKRPYIQLRVTSFLSRQGARTRVAYPSHGGRRRAVAFSLPPSLRCPGTAEGTAVRIRSPTLLKGFLLQDRRGPKIWCLIRSTFHKI